MGIYRGINSQINLGLPIAAPEGFTDPQVKAAVELYIQGLGQLLQALEQYTGITQKDVSLWDNLLPTDTLLKQNSGRLYVIAGVDLAFGNFVELYNDAGVLKARKASAASGGVRAANGYWNVSGGTLTGEYGEVIVQNGLLGVTGLNPGQAIYLSTTAGAASTTPATGAGELEQYLGFGVATDLAYIGISLGSFIQH